MSVSNERNRLDAESSRMSFWAKLNIRQKLLIIFLLLTAVLLAVAIISNITMNNMMHNLNKFDRESEKTILASQLVQDMLRIHREEKNMILAKPNEVESYEKSIQELRDKLKASTKRFTDMIIGDATTTRKERQQVKNFEDKLNKWLKVNEKVRNLKLNGDDRASRVVSGTQGYNTFNQADKAIGLIVKNIREDMRETKKKNSEMGTIALKLISWVTILGTLISTLLVILVIIDISKTLRNTVESLSRGSQELEKAANEQLTGAVALSSTTNEISDTISDLLISAKDISANAAELNEITGKTQQECQRGSVTLNKSQQEVERIKEKVQMIARHMLELGQKLQHISGVLSIINELSEQTNLLSLNATIEAAGAGEAGRRFAVVADEIRKLAERAVESTKEIRAMINDIQQTSSTAIMVTEDGTKAVDEGLLLFQDVLKSFQEIIKLVETRVDTIRQIDYSTRQQTSSIDQLNSSIQNVAETAKQAETSSNKTLKTVLQLVDIANDIEMIIGKKR